MRADGLARFSASLQQAPRRARRSRWSAAALGLALVVVPATALAQLVSFTANSPALAADVNANFQQLKTWLEQKVGTAGNANISTAGTVNAGAITGTALTSSGALNVTGTSTLTGAATLNGAATVNNALTVTGSAALNGAVSLGQTPQTGSTTVGSQNLFQVNGVVLRVKHGNNGSTNCDNFCLNSGYANWSGSCLGARLPGGNFTSDCSFQAPVPPGQELTCLCATYTPTSP